MIYVNKWLILITYLCEQIFNRQLLISDCINNSPLSTSGNNWRANSTTGCDSNNCKWVWNNLLRLVRILWAPHYSYQGLKFYQFFLYFLFFFWEISRCPPWSLEAIRFKTVHRILHKTPLSCQNIDFILIFSWLK